MLKDGSASTIGLKDKLASVADAAVHVCSRACMQAAGRYFQCRDTQPFSFTMLSIRDYVISRCESAQPNETLLRPGVAVMVM